MNTPLPRQILAAVVRAVPEVIPYLSKTTLKAVSLGDINSRYHDAITEALTTYFEGGSVTAPRNDFKQAMVRAFNEAFEAGWIDNGGELPLDSEAVDWLEGRKEEEAGYIDQIFDDAKDLRKDKEFDFFSWISSRADGYTNTLSEIYNQAMTMIRDNVMVTFDGDDGKESCKDCQKLKGQRHKLSWFASRGFVPPHGSGLECSDGGLCEHYLVTDSGDIITA